MNRQQFDSVWARFFSRANAHLAFGMLVALLVIAAACFLGGCTDAASYYKTTSTAALATQAGYVALDRVDADTQTSIRASAVSDPTKAGAAFHAWVGKYDKARKALDVVADTVIGAVREGPPLQGLIANPRNYQKWIDALTTGMAALALALTDAGVNWQQLLASIGGK